MLRSKHIYALLGVAAAFFLLWSSMTTEYLLCLVSTGFENMFSSTLEVDHWEHDMEYSIQWSYKIKDGSGPDANFSAAPAEWLYRRGCAKHDASSLNHHLTSGKNQASQEPGKQDNRAMASSEDAYHG